MAKINQLTGGDLLAHKVQRLADKAAQQAEWLAAHKGWLPCGFVFERPESVKRGPEKITCYGVANPKYFREVTIDGKVYVEANCPRSDDHNRFRDLMAHYGWDKA